ncbi:MAG TPA: M20/M25/M40 family metallo-hydrolase [Pirellulales bacterium]|nr:M20/M25/M40 family metallo-hydrolase [Pirellulales bacterium]
MPRFPKFSLLLVLWATGAPAAETVASSVLSSITATDLRRHAERLADDTLEGREAGSRGGQAAGHYLGREFQRHQLAGGVASRSYYQTFGSQYRNLLGLLEGSDPQLQKEVILVGAHYDHVGYGNAQNSYGPTGYIHNGADDNASGVAGLLELVEAFSRLEARPKRSILFALWDGEEKGLLGSEHWVAHPTVPLDRVRLAINLDMIGRLQRNRVETFGIRSGYGLRRLISLNNADTDLAFDFSWTMREDSDHYSFYKRSVPVLMFHTGLHSDYHRPSDDVEKLDFPGMERIVRLLFGVVYDAATEPRMLGFRPASKKETSETQQQRERRSPPPPGRLGIVWEGADEGQGSGLRVVQVTPESAAARAGVRVGDRLLRFAGHDLGRQDVTVDLRGLVLAARNPVTITVARSGIAQPLDLTVQLAGEPVRLGVSWRTDDAEPQAVVVTRVVPGSPAAQAGIQVNDRLYQVSGQPFTGEAEFRRLVSEVEGDTLDLVAERQGRIRTVSVRLLPSVGMEF